MNSSLIKLGLLACCFAKKLWNSTLVEVTGAFKYDEKNNHKKVKKEYTENKVFLTFCYRINELSKNIVCVYHLEHFFGKESKT